MRTPKPSLALATLARLLLALPAALTAADFEYDRQGPGLNQARITGYNGPGGHVVIPSTIDGLRVTMIASTAFALNSGITSVVVTRLVSSASPVGHFGVAEI